MPGETFVTPVRVDETLRCDLGREVWNVDPALGGQRVLVANAAAEGDDDHAALRLLRRPELLRGHAPRQPPVGHARRQDAKRVSPRQPHTSPPHPRVAAAHGISARRTPPARAASTARPGRRPRPPGRRTTEPRPPRASSPSPPSARPFPNGRPAGAPPCPCELPDRFAGR